MSGCNFSWVYAMSVLFHILRQIAQINQRAIRQRAYRPDAPTRAPCRLLPRRGADEASAPSGARADASPGSNGRPPSVQVWRQICAHPPPHAHWPACADALLAPGFLEFGASLPPSAHYTGVRSPPPQIAPRYAARPGVPRPLRVATRRALPLVDPLSYLRCHAGCSHHRGTR